MSKVGKPLQRKPELRFAFTIQPHSTVKIPPVEPISLRWRDDNMLQFQLEECYNYTKILRFCTEEAEKRCTGKGELSLKFMIDESTPELLRKGKTVTFTQYLTLPRGSYLVGDVSISPPVMNRKTYFVDSRAIPRNATLHTPDESWFNNVGAAAQGRVFVDSEENPADILKFPLIFWKKYFCDEEDRYKIVNSKNIEHVRSSCF